MQGSVSDTAGRYAAIPVRAGTAGDPVAVVTVCAMKRRQLFSLLGTAAFGPRALAAAEVAEPCATPLPDALARHERVIEAWHGIDAARVWDGHAHVIGVGNAGTGTWVHPDTATWLSPIERARRLFIMRAACVSSVPDDRVDAVYVERLLSYANAMPEGYRMLLFAFAYAVDETGREVPSLSTFAVPDAYVRRIAAQHPQRFGWVASVHPYKPDAVEQLERAVAGGARGLKWLPSSMNIDPASARCDAFYAALVRHGLPLIVHGGEEKAAPGARQEALNNPLRLRRALDAGVRVVVAHCASLGHATDTDRGAAGPETRAFDLFARLMDDPHYGPRLHGDVSAILQRNREARVQRALLTRADWHGRLLHGSDYPLPGIGFLYNLEALVAARLLDAEAVPVLDALRAHNPLVFEFVLKRTVAAGRARFSPSVFHTRDFFAPSNP